MVYILSLLLSLSFLYSPKTEKKGPVYFTQPLKISYERKSPAYTLFSEAKKINYPDQKNRNEINYNVKTEKLILSEIDSHKIDFPDATLVSELKISRLEMLEEARLNLNNLAYREQDSTLLHKINNSFKSPFVKNEQSNINAISVQGYFELTDGVGLVDQKVLVKRVKEGQVLEMGQVDLRAGMYQIYVSSAEGDLVAEIRDQNGIIVGEDRKKISGLIRRDHFFQGPRLILGRPTGFALNVRSADESRLPDSLRASIFSGHYNLKKTTDSYPNVARHSSTVTVIDDLKGKLARTLTVRTAQDKSETVLFNANWVNGATQYISEKVQIQYMSEAGFIIGRVTMDGQPVMGAQVVVDNHSSIEPYYLDQFFIPQIDQNSTTQNGYFVIPGLQEGTYQISAFIQNRFLGSQSYFVEPTIVNYQEIAVTQAAQVRSVRSFDAFNGSAALTDLSVPGLEEIVSVTEASAEYRDSSISGLIQIVNRPVQREYIPYIYMHDQAKDFVHLPQITEMFVEYVIKSVSEKYQILKLSEASVFIGFVQMKKFDVDLSDEQFDRRQIVYFNSLGEISNQPIENGGFLIFNIPPGLQEIVVTNSETQFVSSQVFYSENSRNYLSHFAN